MAKTAAVERKLLFDPKEKRFMSGFMILAGYGILLCLIYLFLRNKGAVHPDSVSNMIFAGGQARSRTLIFSVFSAWMWTTSIFGSAETYTLYGIWGPLGYVIGACISFVVFVPVLCSIRKRMPKAVTYLDFLRQRYGSKTKFFFYMFAFLVSAYVLIEQAVGIAIVMEIFFGSSFKWVAFFSVMLAAVFICAGGMKGLLTNETIAFFVILGGFFFFVLFFLRTGQIQTRDMIMGDGSGWLTKAVLIPAFRYFVMAIVIGFGQLVFDPAYYIKGKMAKNTRQLKRAYLFSGIFLWGSICLISSVYLGWASANRGDEVTGLFSGGTALVFAVVITFIGISTVAHFLMGMLGIFTTDYYGTMLRPNATEKEKLVFGRVMTIAVGVFCALVAISLEDISLLTIDVFCAIFFAAPCGPLVLGLLSKKKFGNLPIPATSLGIIGGIIVWILAPADGQWDQFAGMAASLGIPILVMFLGGYGFEKRQA